MRTTLLLLCYMLLAACSDEEKVPKDILPKEKMVPLIIDIYVAESKVSNMGLSRDSSVAIFEVYEDTLFQKHDVEESVYRKSVSYYYDNPTKMEAIYETVLDSLNLREQRLKKAKSDNEEEKRDKAKQKKGKK